MPVRVGGLLLRTRHFLNRLGCGLSHFVLGCPSRDIELRPEEYRYAGCWAYCQVCRQTFSREEVEG